MVNIEIKTETKPIGNVVKDSQLNFFIETMKKLWDTTKVKSSWWRIDKKVNLTFATNFILKALDDLIAYVDKMDGVPGSDKKATVMWTISCIYDYVIKEAMPIWLRPFASAVRNYILNHLISSSIDWIVSKYRNGNWNAKTTDEVEAQWVQLHAQLFEVPMDRRPKVG